MAKNGVKCQFCYNRNRMSTAKYGQMACTVRHRHTHTQSAAVVDVVKKARARILASTYLLLGS